MRIACHSHVRRIKDAPCAHPAAVATAQPLLIGPFAHFARSLFRHLSLAARVRCRLGTYDASFSALALANAAADEKPQSIGPDALVAFLLLEPVA